MIEVEGLISVETFETCPQLGRFTLRDEGRKIQGRFGSLEIKKK